MLDYSETLLRIKENQASLSADNAQNLIVSLTLVSALPPANGQTKDAWNHKSHLKSNFKLHIKQSLLLGFYLSALIQTMGAQVDDEQQSSIKFSAVPVKNPDKLKIFVTKKQSCVYTFTRSPMAHKKYSRIQYNFVHFRVGSSAAHALPKLLIPMSTQDTLDLMKKWNYATSGLSSNLAASQRRSVSFLFSDRALLAV